ncbi:MAG: tRNA epoxyqueuosine(34) reductase QueG [candidate division Zixibacteria bacterium]|nr:tRNA epoxyqueuosine(34) reductase QueG [candidate division Zixibacteria bacterium]MDH3936553.1 tRNA epoxyqueuosine(34) reductase QueG [candidate division Zixibacteria bacterium]MDH4034575.1 tRNA epoxyqueuosine(34) reductase QueG [candidate division Zixibacteria bacterium]
MITADEIKRLAQASGFDLCAVTSPEQIPHATERYRQWLEQGYHGDMAWMAASKERRSDPTHLMDGVRSVIMLGLNYYQENSEPTPKGHARVSRYARGRDYHKVVARKIKAFIARIEAAINRDAVVQNEAEARFKWWVDYGPFLERAYAEKAGMGFIGKNSMLINREFGSWFFLAEIVTSIELEGDTVPDNLHGRCGKCTRCIDACPTGAIVGDGVVDSRRCISYLTIEHRGDIPDDLASLHGDLLFGCDICQEVCPFNQKRAIPTPHEELLPPHGVGEFIDCKRIVALEGNESFLELTAGTPLTRPKLDGLIRNARIVLGNAPKQD